MGIFFLFFFLFVVVVVVCCVCLCVFLPLIPAIIMAKYKQTAVCSGKANENPTILWVDLLATAVCFQKTRHAVKMFLQSTSNEKKKIVSSMAGKVRHSHVT